MFVHPLNGAMKPKEKRMFVYVCVCACNIFECGTSLFRTALEQALVSSLERCACPFSEIVTGKENIG